MSNGQKLRQLRIDASWTQEKLSELLHVNKRTVQRWESGERHCPDLVVMLVERLAEEAAAFTGLTKKMSGLLIGMLIFLKSIGHAASH